MTQEKEIEGDKIKVVYQLILDDVNVVIGTMTSNILSEGAVEVTEAVYWEAFRNAGKVRWDGEKLVYMEG